MVRETVLIYVANLLATRSIRSLDGPQYDSGPTPVKFAALVFCEEFNGVNPGRMAGRFHPDTICRTYPG